MADSLIQSLARSAARRPAHPAVEDAHGTQTYAGLDALSNRARDRFHALGVRRGDRVGICMPKSIDAYAAMLGAMKAGAAYVPIDATAPAWRRAFIAHDCGVRSLVTEPSLTASWRDEAEKLGPLPPLLEIADAGGGHGLTAALDAADRIAPAPPAATVPLGLDDLAYVLYTSGSTGTPKGVMLTHRAATSFVTWCANTFDLGEHDRFSSHAPFHFDLSILDLYVPLQLGATVFLISAEQGKEPMGLAQLIAERRLSVWYSTPTILTLLSEFGKMERHDWPALRIVFFAGEVFPVKHLRAIKQRLPGAAFFNLYGPTETNVCTWHAIPDTIEDDRAEPFPIGQTCSHFRSRVVDASGTDVPTGIEGELVMHGDGMLEGYWNLPERTADAFLIDGEGRSWYRTGDIVREMHDGVYALVGRRDRMVKRRGYRIELGEIEAGLHRHASVREAAVVALKDAEGGVRIRAYLTFADGHKGSEIEVRRFCAHALPSYMIPDSFKFLDGLPRTSTDKVDYQQLLQMR
jgi:amino acid adenylation domain-containing protein